MKSLKITSFNIIVFLSALAFTSMFNIYWSLIAFYIVNQIFAAVLWGYLIFYKDLPKYITSNMRIPDIVLALMGVAGFGAARYELMIEFFERIKVSKSLLIESYSVINFMMNNISFFICCGLIVVSIFSFLLFAWLSIRLRPLIIDFFKKMDQTERIFLYTASVILFVFSVFLFTKTNIFYLPLNEEAQITNDAIYVSDSGSIVGGDAYINPEHGENDIRQPLFGVFAMPFAAIIKTISLPFPFSWFYPLLLNCLQIVLLILSIILIVRMLNLIGTLRKLLIMILFVSSYSVILFSFMMEQYIFSVWWLTLFLYLTIEHKKINLLLFVAAAGSLITTVVLALPFIGYLKNIRNAIIEAGKCLFIFISFIFAFGLLNILVNVWDKLVVFYNAFGGGTTAGMDKIYQYTAFITNMFTAPVFATSINAYGSPQVVLPLYSTVNYWSLGIFLTAIAGFCLNTKMIMSKVCLCWLLFSVLLLLIVGYGVQENGLILYSLYFLWAFMSLMILFFNKVFGKIPVIEYGIYIIAAVFMLYCNFQAMIDIFHFGVMHYPL